MRAFENLTLLWVLPTRVTVFIDFAVRYLSPFEKRRGSTHRVVRIAFLRRLPASRGLPNAGRVSKRT